MALLIVLILGVPDFSRFSGALFELDEFHHWDFFAVAPALQVRAGRALGSQAYSQYGVAFPLLANALSPVAPLRYDNFLKIGVGLGCLYFVGLYLLLRILLRDALWAATGTLVALNLQCFTGTMGRLRSGPILPARCCATSSTSGSSSR